MNIPHIKAIEYCISELVKSKKVNFHSNGGYKLEMKSIPSSELPKTVTVSNELIVIIEFYDVITQK